MSWPVEIVPIPRGVEDFNLYSGTGCVSSVGVLSCVVSDGGTDILLITDSGRPVIVLLSSVLVDGLCVPIQVSDPRAFGL